MMKIAVLGGDGFVGWPTSLHLSDQGHEVHILDNLSRRWIDTELGVQSLTPMDSIQERTRIWHAETGRRIHFHLIDLARNYEILKSWLVEHKPDVVIHFAEQRAAPYSMKSDRHKTYTVNNNVNATHNVLNGIVENHETLRERLRKRIAGADTPDLRPPWPWRGAAIAAGAALLLIAGALIHLVQYQHHVPGGGIFNVTHRIDVGVDTEAEGIAHSAGTKEWQHYIGSRADAPVAEGLAEILLVPLQTCA